MASEQTPPTTPLGRPEPERVRNGLLVRVMLDVLDQAGTPLPAAEVLSRIENQVTLTPYELSHNNTGVRRFETAVRYASFGMSKIGWLDKDRAAGWSITTEGRNALRQYPDDQLYTAFNRRYRDYQEASGGQRTWLVRGSAVLGTNVVGQWLAEGFVSLAASHLRTVDPGISPEELKAAVETDYAHLSYNQRRAKLMELQSFLLRMRPKDRVLTTSEGQVFVGLLDDEPTFTQTEDPRATLRRDVTWRTEGVDFSELPPALAARLRSSATVLDLTDAADLLAVPDSGPTELRAWGQALPSRSAGEPAGTRTAQGPQVQLPDLPDQAVHDLLVAPEWLSEFTYLLRARRQVILHGPPGTGKTYLALAVAEALTDAANVTLVQFHPAYSYEDFFEGYRPTAVDASGRVGFALAPGPLRKLVDRAREDPTTPYFLIIDEINRANLAKVFGELYFLLEYRDRTIDLLYGSGDEGRDFTLPENVHFIGTMNTADRSITALDSAMRRRFAFLSLHPDDPHLRGVLREWLTRRNMPTLAADLLEELNQRLTDRHTKIGHSYFMHEDARTDEGLARIWRTSLLPLLAELLAEDDPAVLDRSFGLTAVRRTVDSHRTEAVSGEHPAADTIDVAGGDTRAEAAGGLP